MFSTQKRQIGIKITILYLIAVVLVAGIGTLALIRLGTITKTVNDLINNLAVDRALADDIIHQVVLTRFYANQYIKTHDQANVDHFDKEFTKLETLLTQADQKITNPKRLEILDQIKPAMEIYGEAFEQVTKHIRNQQRIQSKVLDTQELVMLNSLAALRVYAISLNTPRVFLAITNGQDAFHAMNLYAIRYMKEGDERYAVQFETNYQQALTAFSVLESTLSDPNQRQKAIEAKEAVTSYHQGFYAIHEDYLQLKKLFKTELDVLEPQISDYASAMAASVEQEFLEKRELSQSLILQTKLVLIATLAIAAIAGLILGIVINRRFAERERANKALREAQEKLIRQERLAALGQLAGGVGHELRNPLVVISNAVYYLKMVLTDVDETTQEYLDMIDSETKGADKIITDLLDFARVKAVDREEVSIANLVQEVLQKHPPFENVTVESSLPPNLPRIHVDPGQVKQVLTNLVTNAYQAMPEGGILSIQSSIPDHDDCLLIAVNDTGSGISAENLEKIFEPLFTTKARGIGLGLAISKTLIEANRGKIEVESTEGEGSTFKVYLPVFNHECSNYTNKAFFVPQKNSSPI